MTEEPQVVEAEEKRYPAAWWILLSIFALLLLNALLGAYGREKGPGGERYMQEQMALRQIVGMQNLPVNMSDQMGDTLGETVSALIQKAKTDPEAGKLYLAMRDVQERVAPKKNYPALLKSTKPADRAFVEIFTTEKLTPERAEALAKQIPATPFVNAYARAEARERAGDDQAKAGLVPMRFLFGMVAAGFLFCFGLLIGLALWIVYWSMRRDGKLAPLGHPTEPVSPAKADRLAFRGAQTIALFFMLSTVVGLLMDRQPMIVRSIVMVILMIGMMVFVYKLPVFGKPLTLADVGIRRENLGRNILWGLAGVFANVPLLLIAVMVGALLAPIAPEARHPAVDMLQSNPSALTILGIFLQASLLAPIWEEIMFRGCLFPALARVLKSPLTGALLSSLMFAAIHPQGIALWFGLAAIGTTACALTYQTRSLIPAIVMHGVHNGMTLLIGLLIAG